MKSSDMENILNYNPPLEDAKAISPLTYYQPFQSSFDPEFATAPRQNHLPLSPWGSPATEGPSPASGRGFCPLPSAPLPTTSAAPWDDSERRSLCNSTWRMAAPGASGAPRPPLPGLEKTQSPLLRAMACPRAQPQFPPKAQAAFRGVGHSRSSFRVGGSPGPAKNCDGSRYCPLSLSPLGKNVTQNVYKGVPAAHGRPMMCNFCKNNKEVPDIYLNHYLYDPETKVLSCPVLRKHVCEICGGTGDQAHTLQYCPVNRERGLQAKVPVLLKTRTITNSTGKIRRN